MDNASLIYNFTNETINGLNETAVSSDESTQKILNGFLGIMTFSLNILTVISISMSKTISKKEKVVFLAIISSDTIIGFQILMVRFLPSVDYTSDHPLCEARMWNGIFITFMTITANLMVTIDRFLCMVIPLRFYNKITYKTYLITFISFTASSLIFTFALFHDGFAGSKFCQFIIVGSKTGYAVLGFFMCTVVLVDYSLYIYIVKLTRSHIKRIASTMVSDNTTDNREGFVRKKELNLTITIGIITFAFGVSYFPMGLLFIFSGLDPNGRLNYPLFKSLLTFYMLNSLVNPMIYIWRLKSCRNEMINRILCRPIMQVETQTTNSITTDHTA